MSMIPSRSETRLINSATDAFIAAKIAVASVDPMKVRLAQLHEEVAKLEADLAASDDLIAQKEKALEESLAALEADRREKHGEESVTRDNLEKMIAGIVDNLIYGGFASVDGEKKTETTVPVRRGRRKKEQEVVTGDVTAPEPEAPSEGPSVVSKTAEVVVVTPPPASDAPADTQETIAPAASTSAEDVVVQSGDKDNADAIVSDGTDGLGDVGDVFPGDENADEGVNGQVASDPEVGAVVENIEDTFVASPSAEEPVSESENPATEVSEVELSTTEAREEVVVPVATQEEATIPVVTAPPVRRSMTPPASARPIVTPTSAVEAVSSGTAEEATTKTEAVASPAEATPSVPEASPDAVDQETGVVIPPQRPRRHRFDPANAQAILRR